MTFESGAGMRFEQALREGNPVELKKGEYTFQLLIPVIVIARIGPS